ncbi:MAG: hypothetical protein ACREGK_03840 [Geminicoccales bacterium]
MDVLREARGSVRSSAYAVQGRLDVSKEEKTVLVAGLKRIDQRSLIEALVALALITSLFLTGVVRSETPVGWILAFFTLALVVVTWRSLLQRNRLIEQALGNRVPDIRRVPFWTVLWQSRRHWWEPGCGSGPARRHRSAGLAARGRQLFWRSCPFSPLCAPKPSPMPRQTTQRLRTSCRVLSTTRHFGWRLHRRAHLCEQVGPSF